MARKKTITKRRRGLFLAELEKTGNVTLASRKGEIGRSSWYDLRDRDESFAEAWNDAELAFLEVELEGEAIRRGTVGHVDKIPYVNIDAKGNKVTKFRDVRKRSDACLLATLKARHPAYKDKRELEPGPDGSTAPERERTANYDNLSDDELRVLVALERKARGQTGT